MNDIENTPDSSVRVAAEKTEDGGMEHVSSSEVVDAPDGSATDAVLQEEGDIQGEVIGKREVTPSAGTEMSLLQSAGMVAPEEPDLPDEDVQTEISVEEGTTQDIQDDDNSYVRNNEAYDAVVMDEPVEAARLEESISEEENAGEGTGQFMTDSGPVEIAPVDEAVNETEAGMSGGGLPPEVMQVVDSHILWLESQHADGRRADFRSFNLQGADFSGMRLAEANFRGVDLSGAIFDNADIRGADFSDSILVRTSFSGSNLSGANMSRCEADFGNFEYADMTGVNLGGAQLRGARFRNVQLSGATLRDCVLQNAVLMQANLREAVLKNADMCDAVLEDADMTMADCRGADFERAIFTRAIVDQAEFRGANMSDTDLNATNFAHAQNVDTKFQAQSYETGRQELQEDLGELEHLQQEIARREKAMYNDRMELEREKEHIQNLQTQEKEIVSRLRRHIKWFKISSVVWLVLALAFLSFTMNAITKIDADKLNVLELAIVFTVVAVVMLLFVGSFLISVLINRNLNKMQALREGGVSVARDSMPQAEIVAHGEDTAGIPSPDEVFGKKQD